MSKKPPFYNFKKIVSNHQKRIEKLLRKYLTATTQGTPKNLAKAMHYVVLSGGKRIRPLLMFLIAEAYKIDIKLLDAPLCAIEMIHAFSLVHDDLPAMDNDTLRRGKPACHIAFGEATAILVGDALMAAAFQILSKAKSIPIEKKLVMIEILAEASGPAGMAGGQYIDLHPMKGKPSKNNLEKMYLMKTGALISAAIKIGALMANVNGKALRLLEQFAMNIGLAFQIKDDILNIEGIVDKLGKNIGTDQIQNKITYPALVGIEKAKLKVNDLWSESKTILRQLKIKNKVLLEFTDYLMKREF